MTDQTRFDADHVQVFAVVEIRHGGGLFGTWIPHHGTHGAGTAIDLSRRFDADGTPALVLSDVHVRMNDRVFFGVQVQSIRLALQYHGIIVRLHVIFTARDLCTCVCVRDGDVE